MSKYKTYLCRKCFAVKEYKSVKDVLLGCNKCNNQEFIEFKKDKNNQPWKNIATRIDAILYTIFLANKGGANETL